MERKRKASALDEAVSPSAALSLFSNIVDHSPALDDGAQPDTSMARASYELLMRAGFFAHEITAVPVAVDGKTYCWLSAKPTSPGRLLVAMRLCSECKFNSPDWTSHFRYFHHATPCPNCQTPVTGHQLRHHVASCVPRSSAKRPRWEEKAPDQGQIVQLASPIAQHVDQQVPPVALPVLDDGADVEPEADVLDDDADESEAESDADEVQIQQPALAESKAIDGDLLGPAHRSIDRPLTPVTPLFEVCSWHPHFVSY